MPYYQQEYMVSDGSDLLFRVVGGVSEYPRINPTSYPVRACDNDPVYHCMNEVVIKNVFPNGLNELAPAVSHELTALGVPLWVPARDPALK